MKSFHLQNEKIILIHMKMTGHLLYGKYKLLKNKWNIKTRIKIKKYGKKRYERLTIGSYDLVTFVDLIRPYIIPSMLYKISDPLTTYSIKRRHRI